MYSVHTPTGVKLSPSLPSVGSRIPDVCAPGPPAEVSMVGVTVSVPHLQFCAVTTSADCQGWPRLVLAGPVLLFSPEIFLLNYLFSSLSCQFWETIQPGAGGEWSANSRLRSEEWGLTLTSYMASQSHLSQAPASTQCRRPASHHQSPVTALQHGLCLQHRGRGK